MCLLVSQTSVIEQLRKWAKALKRELTVAWLAARDPQTPWWLRAWWMFTLGYALSPIDLIPDFIPIFGLLDDLILLPIMLWLGFRWTASEVLQRARAQADREAHLPASKIAGLIIALIWVVVIGSLLVAFCL
jgi:uncharacterized membrane protein YkvA (DUF1232 family)